MIGRIPLLKGLIQDLDDVEGLRLNIHKSKLTGIGVNTGEVVRAAKVFGCSTFTTPFTYLGIMVPKGVLKLMESIRTQFFNESKGNERKMTWMCWDKVLASKKEGGLSVSKKKQGMERIPYSGTRYFSPIASKREESEQYIDICNRPNKVQLSQMHDQWFWSLVGMGDFSVKSVRNLVDDTLLPSDSFPTRWIKMIPIKVNVFVCSNG
ncbi:hypothetical protein Tco_0587719 [Tanacetum coccineum]